MVQDNLRGAIVQVQNETIDNKVAVYFDIIQEHSVSLQSQITDNWMENNSVIGDHIANSPIVVNLRGLSGEIKYIPSTTKGILNDWYNNFNGRLGAKGLSTEKLGAIPAFFCPVDNLTQLAKNTVTYIEASVNRYKTIVENFLNQGQREERIRTLYRDLSSLRENKTALIVQTPYGFFDNMYIQALTLRQGNENYITDIELSLKQVYFTDTQWTAPDKEVLEQLNGLQRQAEVNHGKTQGNNENVSIIYSLYHGKG